MPMLRPTEIRGTVRYLGIVADSEADICSTPLETVEAGWEGFSGDCHSGLTRPSCVRVRAQYPQKGTEIRNTRQVSILSSEELAEIATALGIPEVKPEWLGASLVIEGIPALTSLPPCSRLQFEGGAVLATDMENGPCRYPAEVIERHHPGHGMAFPKLADGKRGITGWVEHPGQIALGESVRLHVPPIRLYAPLAG